MPSTLLPTFPTTSATTSGGVTRIDLNFATAVSKGSGAIFITDGSIQTVIDRVTGQPTLRVVGASFTKQIALEQVSISGTHVLFDAAGLPAGRTWQVYMGAGTLLGGGKPLAAITVPGSASFTTPAATEPPSGLSATIAVESKVLKAGVDIHVTLSFSKPVASLNPEAFSAEHASIKNAVHSSDFRTWTLTLGAADSIASSSNLLRVDMSQITSTDGSRGSGTLTSPAYAVDTVVDAYLFDYLSVNDEGPSDEDGITNDDSQYVGGGIIGTLAADEHIELIINGRTVPTALIHVANDGEFGFWYYDPEGESGAIPAFNEGANSVTARIVNSTGHSSVTVSRTVTLDTDAPAIVTSPAGRTGVALDANLVITFNQAVYWSPEEGDSDLLYLHGDDGSIIEVYLSAASFSNGGKTLTITPAQHHLQAGTQYALVLPDNLMDLAGNAVQDYEIVFSTVAGSDTTPPSLQRVIVEGDGNYRAGEAVHFRLRFNENIKVIGDAIPALTLSNGKRATLASIDGNQLSFRYTVASGDDTDNLTIASMSELAGNFEDFARNVLDSAHLVYDGMVGDGGYGITVDIDTAAARPGAPGLHPDSDTGSTGDRATSDTTPHLFGTGAEPEAEIALWIGSVRVGTAYADETGAWDTVLESALSVGTHEIRATQEDLAGNVSALSDALALTITAVSAGLGAPTLLEANDSGVSNNDGITAYSTPELRGSGPASTTLKLLRDGVEVAEVTTDASGAWSHTLPELADGMHAFSVRQGATGPASPTLSVRIDRDAPAVASSPAGALNLNPDGDLVIVFSEAVHIGAAEDDWGRLLLRDNADNVIRIAREAMSLSADRKTLTIAAAQHNMAANTDYRVTLPATLTDVAGNALAAYDIAFRTGNDLLPTATRAIVSGDHSFRAGESIQFRIRFNETIERVGSGSLSLGLSNGKQAAFTSISGNEANFSYTVAPGDDMENVQISDAASLVGKIADLSGNLLDAAHIVFSGLYDGSGYGSWIDIDTVAPGAPALPALDTASDSGAAGDGITDDTTPTLRGTADPGARVEIYEGSTLLASASADAAGAWNATLGTPLTPGVHNLTARQLDAAGNSSAASGALALTIDTVAPVALAVPGLANDTGLSATDRITRETRPVLRGSGAEAHAAIKIMLGTEVVGVGTADEDGDWDAYFGDALPEGTHTFTVRQVDRAGHASLDSTAFGITVDTTRPAAPDTAALAAGSDSGAAGDGITNVHSPTLRGTANANTRVVLYVDEREVGRADTDASGNWSFTLDGEDALEDGYYSVGVKQSDVAGNLSGFSAGLNLRIDSSAPGAPETPRLSAASDNGAPGDGITSDTTPTLQGGGAESGATVVLYSGASEIARVVADSGGNWEYTFPDASPLAEGSYTFTARQIDKAGNTGGLSGGTVVVIDADAATTSFGSFGGLAAFRLGGLETIVLRPGGEFALPASTAAASTLEDIGAAKLTGVEAPVMRGEPVPDLAAGVAIVGTPDWPAELRPLAP